MPSGHSVNVEAPVDELYAPAGANVQLEDPVFENEPGWHDLAGIPPLQYEPLGHGEHEELPVVVVVYPAAQFKQPVAPLLDHVATGQLLHDVALIMSEYIPAEQAEQVLAAEISL